jgi:WD40 repeat protein
VCSSGEEDLSTALQHVAEDSGKGPQQDADPQHQPEEREEVVDDFVRNFLVSVGLHKTADVFQAEWYELQVTGRLPTHLSQTLPDVHAQNRQLEERLGDLERELLRQREAARVSQEQYVRLKKERDYHRMQHRRIVQEKALLATEADRLRKHFSSYEPLLQTLRKKYQSVTREKTLASLERDRALSEVECLQSTLHSVQQKPSYLSPEPSAPVAAMSVKPAPTVIPGEPANPYLQESSLPSSTHLTRTGGLQPVHTFSAHQFATSSVAVHPSKEVMVTASDDHTWKMWTLQSCELLMTGEGHSDWLSHAAFHPSGDLLATTSGDGSVKLWDFTRACCSLTLSEHRQPVWQCSWHWSGQFLASGGMDHCSKLWDIARGLCVSTLRGHSDSVNAVHFLPFSNSLLSASADKTLSLWDIRTGLCVQTYTGHQNSCNDVISDLKGQRVFSCDSLGGLLSWDIRTPQEPVQTWNLSPAALHSVAVDPAGLLLACARGDGVISLLDTSPGVQEWSVSGHEEECVWSVVFSPPADCLVSSSANGSVVIWR